MVREGREKKENNNITEKLLICTEIEKMTRPLRWQVRVSARSSVLSSQARPARASPGSSQTRLTVTSQARSQQPAPDLVSSESPGVISQHFQVFSLQYAQMVIF